jgi:hypothetical protein
MNTIKRSLVLLFFFLITSQAFAIDPVYEGPNGIRAQVFATNCLACHSSELTGPDRNGAPPEINFDTYAATLPNAERAMVRAVEEMSMPPAGSGIPQLNDEQKAAMLAWQSTGFPNTIPSNSSFDGTVLILPVLNIGDQKARATLIATPLKSSPTGYGFVLDSVAPSTMSSDKAATFDPETGQMLLPSVELIEKGVSQGSGDAQMTWVTGSAPMLFTLESPSFPIISSPATFDGHLLTLPVVNVGNQKYHAILKSIPLLTSPTGGGFVLDRAELTTASSDDTATFNPETGQIVLPVVKLIQNGVRQGVMFIDMELVKGSNPLLFSITGFSAIPASPWYPGSQ